MGVSENVLRVIENNRSRIVNDLPTKHFLIDLRNDNILNGDDINELEATTPQKTQDECFIRIIVKRNDQVFYKFCHLLRRNQANEIQNLGEDLLQQALDGNWFNQNIIVVIWYYL